VNAQSNNNFVSPENEIGMQRVAGERFLRALSQGHEMTVHRMIEQGRVTLQCPDPLNGWTTLLYAIKYGLNDTVKFVLDHGHEAYGISQDVKGNTALMIAILFDNANAFAMYIDRYPEAVEIRNLKGETALIVASIVGNTAMIESLIQHGADVNAKDAAGCTGLHYAAAWGHTETMQLLISHGCVFNAANNLGWTPIDFSYSSEIEAKLREFALEAVELQKAKKRRSRIVSQMYEIEE
jgi:ankyrin repeat protein